MMMMMMTTTMAVLFGNILSTEKIDFFSKISILPPSGIVLCVRNDKHIAEVADQPNSSLDSYDKIRSPATPPWF